MRLRLVPAALATLAVLTAPLGAQQPAAPAASAADLIVTNARIYTVDQSRPTAEAMAVRGGKVQFTGSARGALALRGPNTQVIDLGGRTVIPGMTDAHAHFLGLGEALRDVDLTGTRSYDEVIARVVARAASTPAGSWIVGRGWDQNDWGNTAFPTHEKLTAALPNHPVYLTRVDGHAGLANALAMQKANVTAASQDPSGGRIERAAGGAPTGVFVDNAQGLVGRVIPDLTPAEVRQALVAAMAEMNRWGLTGIHDAGAGRRTIDLYEELARSGALSVRTYAMISGDSSAIAHYFARGPQSAPSE